eukprot:1161971-Pelagomonas_calceolata.AAC.3
MRYNLFVQLPIAPASLLVREFSFMHAASGLRRLVFLLLLLQRAVHVHYVQTAVLYHLVLKWNVDVDARNNLFIRLDICHSSLAVQYGQTAVLYHPALKWNVDVDALRSNRGAVSPSIEVERGCGRARQRRAVALALGCLQGLCRPHPIVVSKFAFLSERRVCFPLHWAAYEGNADPIRLLLVLDASFSAADKEGCTPLHWAAIKGNGEACTVLLQGGSSSVLGAKDVTGSTPAQLAVEKGHSLLDQMHCRAITAESYGQGILPLHLFLGGGRSCESTYEQGSGVGLKEKSMVASYMVLFSTLGIASWLSWSTALG